MRLISSSPGHFGAQRASWLFLIILVLSAATLVACEDEDSDPGGEDVDLPTNQIEITVGDGGLDPAEAEVRLPDRYQLIVNNESDEDCKFSLGTFVRALDVPAGETAQVDVQLPAAASGEAAPGAEEVMEMGCDGDAERQGRLILLTATGAELGN